ncbi:hypothetical protein DFH06DRAFT_1241940, partial [Mycena polygramma]
LFLLGLSSAFLGPSQPVQLRLLARIQHVGVILGAGKHGRYEVQNGWLVRGISWEKRFDPPVHSLAKLIGRG